MCLSHATGLQAEYLDPATLKDRIKNAAGISQRHGEARRLEDQCMAKLVGLQITAHRPEDQQPVSADIVSGTGTPDNGGAGQLLE